MKPIYHSSRRDSRPRLSSGAKLPSLLLMLSRFGRTGLAALREIFDEAPYERFLTRHQLEAGIASYADFCREHQQNKVRRPRCC
jgi:hypothetical protein